MVERPPFTVTYPYSLLALLLGITLLVPLGFKAYRSDYEPYPAILLPGGGSVASVDPAAHFHTVVRAYGIDRKGRLVLLDPRQLLYPVPGRFFAPLYYRGAFSGNGKGEIPAGIADRLRPVLSDEDLRNDSFVIRELSLAFDPKSDREVEMNVIKEYRLALP